MRTHRRHVADRFSEGARLLWAVLDKRGWTQQQLATHLEASKGTLSNWLYGTRLPGLQARMTIQLKLRIGWKSWDQPPTVTFVPPGAAADLQATGTDGA